MPQKHTSHSAFADFLFDYSAADAFADEFIFCSRGSGGGLGRNITGQCFILIGNGF